MGRTVAVLDAELGLKTAKFNNNLAKSTKNMNTATAKMKTSMAKAQQGFKKLEGAIFSVQGAMVGLGAAAILGGLVLATKAYEEQQEAVTLLNSSLQATGRFSDEATQRLQANASALQQVTTAGDEAILKATATVAILAKNLKADEFTKVQKALVGLADTFFKGNLESAAIQLGKSIGTNVNALSRYGVELDTSASQQDKLNAVVEQTNVLFEQSKTLATTYRGRVKQLNNAWGNLQETIGSYIIESPVMANAIQMVTNAVITSDKFIQKNRETINWWIGAMAGGAKNITKFADWVVRGLLWMADGLTNFLINSVNEMRKFSKSVYSFFGRNDLADEIPMMKNKNWHDKYVNAFNFKGLETKLVGEANGVMGTVGTVLSGGGKSGKKGKGSKKAGGISATAKDLKLSRSIMSAVTSGTKGFYKAIDDSIKIMEKLEAKVDPVTDRLINMGNTAFLGTRTQIENYNSELADLNELYTKNFISADTFGRAQAQLKDNVFGPSTLKAEQLQKQIHELNEAYLAGIFSLEEFENRQKAVRESYDTQYQAIQNMERAIQNYGQSFEDAFINGLQTGEFSFKNFASSVLENISRMIFRMEVLNRLFGGQTITGGTSTGLITKGISALAGGLFGGGQALIGPPVPSNLPAFAEGTAKIPQDMNARLHKDEMVIPPNFSKSLRSGDLSLSKNGGGGAGNTVNIVNHITVKDSGGNGQQAGNEMAKLITQQVRSAVTNELRVQQRNGGVLAQGAY